MATTRVPALPVRLEDTVHEHDLSMPPPTTRLVEAMPYGYWERYAERLKLISKRLAREHQDAATPIPFVEELQQLTAYIDHHRHRLANQLPPPLFPWKYHLSETRGLLDDAGALIGHPAPASDNRRLVDWEPFVDSLQDAHERAQFHGTDAEETLTEAVRAAYQHHGWLRHNRIEHIRMARDEMQRIILVEILHALPLPPELLRHIALWRYPLPVHKPKRLASEAAAETGSA